ncbi:MAG: hypothetical protein WD533_02535 [Dehalococcoidia bacterium]
MSDVVEYEAPLEELQAYEATIERGLATFVEVGEALEAIRAGRLYRAAHDTFEDYCRARWGLDRTYAHRVMAAAEVSRMLPIGNKPTAESQARPMVGLPVEQAQEAWSMANATAASEGKRVTARHVKQAAQVYRVPHAPKPKYPIGQEGRFRRAYDQSLLLFEEWSDIDFMETPVPRDYERMVDRLADGWSGLRGRITQAQQRPTRRDEGNNRLD